MPLVQSVAGDDLIPLITTVPAGGTRKEALEYIARQHERLCTGAGYSFAIAEADTGQAVGQIGLWLHSIYDGRASTGYWIAPQYRRRGYLRAALQALTAWALALEGSNAWSCMWSRGTRGPGALPSCAVSSARVFCGPGSGWEPSVETCTCTARYPTRDPRSRPELRLPPRASTSTISPCPTARADFRAVAGRQAVLGHSMTAGMAASSMCKSRCSFTQTGLSVTGWSSRRSPVMGATAASSRREHPMVA